MKLHNHLLKFSIIHHLLNDVQTAYKLAFDDELWERRPIVQLLQAWGNQASFCCQTLERSGR